MKYDTAKLERRLQAAKTRLVLNHPFVGTLVMQMPHKLDPDLDKNWPYPGTQPTAATDGREVRYYPPFVDKLTDQELLFVVAHETFHPMFDHNTRRKGRNPLLWNIAADYVINQHLTDEGIGKRPDFGLYDPDLFRRGDGVTERIYSILQDQAEKNGNGMPDGDGMPMDNCEDGAADGAGNEELEQHWKSAVAGAMQVAKARGNVSGNMQRLFDEVMRPKVDWRNVLQRFVEKCRTDERTWARFNRRMYPQGYLLPSTSGESMGEIAFCIDCSGSVSQSDLAQFSAEVLRVSEDLNPRAIHVVYFDSEVCHYEKYDRDNPFTRLVPHGGGGTAFSPCFEYMRKHEIDPVACVFLTDLYCSDFGQPQEYPVLWVTYGAEKAPWGEVVKMED